MLRKIELEIDDNKPLWDAHDRLELLILSTMINSGLSKRDICRRLGLTNSGFNYKARKVGLMEYPKPKTKEDTSGVI